ncbi:MAG: endolytic transglycosylase MltG [Flavobacteriales bacterium]|jgi:UPF0755 protein|nr:endolytic transglycosylase MltG [Flavobacteriales bacterium]
MKKYRILTFVILILTAVVIATGWHFYNQIFRATVSTSKVIYIPKGAHVGKVIELLEGEEIINNPEFFKFLAETKKFTDNRVVGGRYEFKKGSSLNDIINKLRIGERTPIKLKFNEVKDIYEIASEIAAQMELDSTEFIDAITDIDFLQKNNLTQEQLPAIFIPNTYEVYWNQSAKTIRDRLLKEYHHFWNEKRLAKAKKLKLTPIEITTLASIVKKETYVKSEFRTVAGLYYNRIRKGMLLQSDPTVIFAIQQKNPGKRIKRVLYKDLKINSPYNTYLNPGLPPGPIAIPNSVIIDAVLRLERHNYIYMCAKPTLDGSHNFAISSSEHSKNAAAYRKALDERRVLR